MVRKCLLILSLLGMSLMGGVFTLSYVAPLELERIAREVVRIEVERQVGEAVDRLSDSKVAALARRELRKTTLEIERTESAIKQQIPRKVALVVADMLQADCECRERLVASADSVARGHLESLQGVQNNLVGLIESAYSDVRVSLLREVRIFSASNALAFILLGVVCVGWRKASIQLILPAVVLVGAVLVTGSLYLFNQNWLHTVIFGQYVGLTYTLYLLGVGLLLADVAFNRARVTTRAVNWMLNIVGAAVSVAAC